MIHHVNLIFKLWPSEQSYILYDKVSFYIESDNWLYNAQTIAVVIIDRIIFFFIQVTVIQGLSKIRLKPEDFEDNELW